jgi:hypothetical protein
MGGRGGRSGGGGGGGDGFKFTRGTFGIGALLVIGLWAFNSFYTVRRKSSPSSCSWASSRPSETRA